VVTQNTPTTTNKCGTRFRQRLLRWHDDSQLLRNFRSGISIRPGDNVQSATDNITWVPRNTPDSYVENFFLSVQKQLSKNTLVDVAYVGNHGLKLQGFLNGNQKSSNVSRGPTPTGRATLPKRSMSSGLTSTRCRYVTSKRFVGGLTLLNSFTGNTRWTMPRPRSKATRRRRRMANNIKADYAQIGLQPAIANVTSLVYEVPVGQGRRFVSGMNGAENAVLGGWQSAPSIPRRPHAV